MSQFTPQMEAALAAGRVTVWGALKIDLNDGRTVRLLDGAGRRTWAEGTFKGRDDTFGILASVDGLDDGTGDTAPALQLTLHPATAAAAADLSAPGMQGSRVRLWLGASQLGSVAVIPDPFLLFDGELDQPTLTAGKKEYTLELECVSALERLFDNDEGARLSDAFHQSIWPGETGLSFVTGITRKVIWGPGQRPEGITYADTGFSGGGGSFANVGGFVGATARMMLE